MQETLTAEQLAIVDALRISPTVDLDDRCQRLLLLLLGLLVAGESPPPLPEIAETLNGRTS